MNYIYYIKRQNQVGPQNLFFFSSSFVWAVITPRRNDQRPQEKNISFSLEKEERSWIQFHHTVWGLREKKITLYAESQSAVPNEYINLNVYIYNMYIDRLLTLQTLHLVFSFFSSSSSFSLWDAIRVGSTGIREQNMMIMMMMKETSVGWLLLICGILHTLSADWHVCTM